MNQGLQQVVPQPVESPAQVKVEDNVGRMAQE